MSASCGEPGEKRSPVVRDHHLAGEESDGVLTVDWGDQVGQQVVEHLAARDDLGS
jgi:hypothetical protein